MIFGLLAKDQRCKLDNRVLRDGFGALVDDGEIHVDGPMAMALTKTRIATLDGDGKFFHQPGKGFAALQGNIYNRADFLKSEKISDAGALFDLCATGSRGRFAELNGSFAAACWETGPRRLILLRDHLGIEPLYYYENDQTLLFATSLKALMRHREVRREIDPVVLYRYLLFNYNPTWDTFIARIRKVPPGHFLEMADGKLRLERYWRLSYGEPFSQRHERLYREELLELLKDAIRLRLPAPSFTSGAFLSGGMDSSSVVGLMRPMLNGDTIHTFSFRCEGKSFDESTYAKLMSDAYQTEHHQVEFSPEEVRQVDELVEHMDEPFSDIGIEVASFLLGRYAGKFVHCVLTGDGGDELFAGHPVYVADKVANAFDKVPRFIRKTVTEMLQNLPDTDDKKSLAVKAKRFSYSINFSPALHSNRWRIYYTPPEMRRLCTAAILQSINGHDPAAAIADVYKEADGPDYLSRTLYGDYFTVVDFYLRRLQIVRSFGVEARTPMFDRRLVEYAARIPSHLKIRGYDETKYILHKTMEGVLPDEIVFRKDKLGHSVPMKNWMRDAKVVRNLIDSTLSPEAVKRRGLFNPEFVQNMIAQHQNKSHNHSHRLWSLMMLELWLQKNIDRVGILGS
jgi:asparagine synthase (glutamine-hydrolysing)